MKILIEFVASTPNGICRTEPEERRKTGRKVSDSDEEESEPERPNRGVAIAPPPVLQDASSLDTTPRSAAGAPSGASVAAKIMAKYGFKVRIYIILF